MTKRRLSSNSESNDSAAHSPRRSPPRSQAPNNEDVLERAAFPIVGMGASAGGLLACESFFSAIPSDSDLGMAFVLVQHLSPDHHSLLARILGAHTAMTVCEASDGMVVSPNHVYVIPPNCDLEISAGHLKVFELGESEHPRRTIDHFFQSLAEDRREMAIAVVLSGSGSDGSSGIRAIKEAGGLVLVQDPTSTEHDGMPRSAIHTGLADFVLTPSQMPSLLCRVGARIVSGDDAREDVPTTRARDQLRSICALLRARTGHDFSQYKESTVIRRIERRMAIHQLDGLDEYRDYLQEHPEGADELLRDLLIGVTSFFRDAEAFEVLDREVLPRLFQAKTQAGGLRVWVCGCSTGEEAYSIAILLHEHLQQRPEGIKVQIFATDIDARAVEHARIGRFPATIAGQMSAERLARHFSRDAENGDYLVSRTLRDMVLFSEQDVTRDPPFSRLDIISCRNLLIYVNGELQKRLIPLFHYALVPEGILFLGPSETTGETPKLFSPIDRKWKLYLRKRSTVTPASLMLGDFHVPLAPYRAPNRRTEANALGEPVSSLRSITEQALLEHFAESAVLVNMQGQILHIYGRTGRFLEPAPGDAAMNVLDMARDGLKRELATSLHHAVTTTATVARTGLVVHSVDSTTTANLTVRPISPMRFGATTPEPLFLVVFSAVEQHATPAAAPAIWPGEAGAPRATPSGDAPERVTELERELRAKEEYLQTTIEELETSNEELRSVNEELQSVNEELQSTNEELETSKEELQSVNEELATVNAELQNKVTELSRANNDMNNLLASTGVGTLFVDKRLRISRFTPAVTDLINLIPSDVGRPLGHIVSNFESYNQLTADVQRVLETLVSNECTVRTTSGIWYLMRMRPYRTVENVVDGVVVTFVDISPAKQAEATLRRSAQLPDADPSPILRAGQDGSLRYANDAARNWLERHSTDAADQLPADMRGLLQSAFERDIAVQADFGDDQGRNFAFTAVRMPEEDYAQLYGVDVTERSRLGAAHGVALAIAEGIAANVDDPLLVLDAQLHIMLANQAFLGAFALGLEQVEGHIIFKCGRGDWDRPELREFFQRVTRSAPASPLLTSVQLDANSGPQPFTIRALRSPLLEQRGEIIVVLIRPAASDRGCVV